MFKSAKVCVEKQPVAVGSDAIANTLQQRPLAAHDCAEMIFSTIWQNHKNRFSLAVSLSFHMCYATYRGSPCKFRRLRQEDVSEKLTVTWMDHMSRALSLKTNMQLWQPFEDRNLKF